MEGFIEFMREVWGGSLPVQLVRAILVAAIFELLVFLVNRSIRARTATALRLDAGREPNERMRRRRIVQGLPMMLTRGVLYVVAFLMILRIFGVQTSAEVLPVLILLVVSALVVARRALRDAMEGWLIHWDDLYAVGDRVTIGEHRGTVTGMSLRSTWLRTRDGREIVIPHSKVELVSNEARADEEVTS
ncbi:MAG: mechanosensitive ion channel [candidate division WS1 bacterium]|nr:mechanosensitive ion channel [candidate division WS1 bacterium]